MNIIKKSGFVLTVLLLAVLAISSIAMARESEGPVQQPTSQGDTLAIALAHLEQHKASLGLTAADLAEAKVTDTTVSRLSGVTTIYLVQQLDGIEVFNGLINISIMPNGDILTVGNRFVPDLAGSVSDRSASLSAEAAVQAAAAHLGLAISQPLETLEAGSGAAQETLFSAGGISQNPIPARLVYDASGKAPRLAWNVIIYQLDSLHWWNVRVDANTGTVLSQNDWVVSENFDAHGDGGQRAVAAAPAVTEAGQAVPFGPTPVADGSSYRVYHLPVESPNHTTPLPPADGRTLENEPADAGGGSPFGWHDTNGAAGAEFTTTQGNNTHAYTDTDANNTPDPGSSPDGGAGLDFDFPLDLTQPPSAYRPAAVTNLFHWNNLMHDVNYRYGFDEEHGNFQENNYGNGGLGSDYVNAEAQDGSGTNNANFATPADGQNPRMQMYVGTNPTPDVDGDLDNGVIAHEYGHGISNRMVGGPSNVGCLGNNEQMGEGWSDWQALIMTMETGDAGTDARGIGTYLFGQPPNGPGIRPAPYSTDFGVNNFTYGDLPPLAIPHGVGFLWATMLWQMNWGLIAEHGFDEDLYLPSGPPSGWSGNQLAHALVTEGFNHTVCSPGFVDGRDAILAADLALTGGENQCTIWEAFAVRGLGFSASQGSNNSTGDGTEAFDMPPGCLTLDVIPTSQDICQGDTAVYLVSVGADFTAPVAMSATGNPAPSTATFDPNPVTSVPDITDLTIANTGSVPAGSYTITIMGDDGTLTDTIDAGLTVFAGTPNAPTLLTPANMSTDVPVTPDFTWSAVANATSYDLEVADDINFTNIVYTATVDSTSHSIGIDDALAFGTWHYWRVTAVNACGGGAVSAIFSFQTVPTPGSCAPGETPLIHYETDLEDGAPGWTHSGTQDSWMLSSAQTTSGVNAWYAEDHDTLSDQRLVAPAVVLPDASQSPITLIFENRQAFETPNGDGRCWDAGILEISTNGGSSWAQVPPSAMLTDPYNNIIWNDQPGNNPITNDYGATMAWCDPGTPPVWVTSIVDLNAYAGSTVNLRWRLGSDSFVGNEGWYLDDVSVQSCVPSGYGVLLSPDQADSGAPGDAVTYTLSITNTGSLSDTFDLEVDAQWTTLLSQSSITLDVGEVGTFTAVVTVPGDATPGDMGTAVVTATSQSDAGASDEAFLATTATAVYGVSVLADPDALFGEPGTVVTYTVHLTNTGNTTDTFSLSATDDNGWTSHVETTSVTLAAGEMAMVMVMVHVPIGAANGEMNVTTVTAVSDTDAAATDSAALTTTAGSPGSLIYLPIILKP